MNKLYVNQRRIRQTIFETTGAGEGTIVYTGFSIHVEVDDLALVLRRRVHEHNSLVEVVLQFQEKEARQIKAFLNEFYPE